MFFFFLLDRDTGFDNRKSLLFGRRVTCVCSWQERIGWLLTFLMYGKYHLSTTNGNYLEKEVRNAIGSNKQKLNFIIGSRNHLQLLIHGTEFDHRRTHIVEDNNLLTSRFPGDAWIFGKKFLYKLYQ